MMRRRIQVLGFHGHKRVLDQAAAAHTPHGRQGLLLARAPGILIGAWAFRDTAASIH